MRPSSALFLALLASILVAPGIAHGAGTVVPVQEPLEINAVVTSGVLDIDVEVRENPRSNIDIRPTRLGDGSTRVTFSYNNAIQDDGSGVVAGEGCSVAPITNNIRTITCTGVSSVDLDVTNPQRSNGIRVHATDYPGTSRTGARVDSFLWDLSFDHARTVDGGAGRDTLELTGSGIGSVFDPTLRHLPLRYSNDGVANDGFDGRQPQNFIGFEAFDSTVSPSATTIVGGAEAETFSTGSGADDIRGGGGSDVIDPGAGRDTVSGGPGVDTFRLRDGVADVIDCDDATDTFDLDLRDAATIETCTSRLSVLAPALKQLDQKIRSGAIVSTAGRFPKVPRVVAPRAALSITKGAVREKPNAQLARRALIVDRGRVRVRLTCPRATVGGCRGRVELRTPSGALLGRSSRHALRNGRSGWTTVTLTATGARRAGVRLVRARVLETGQLGLKTTVRVLPLVVPRR